MTTYPVHVRARLDAPVSRWLWLVKWLLAIPHYVVLAVLWVAFAVLSVVAFVAIAVTGRYPRSIFEFNVGVLRWHWRVACYGYSALSTDRYPPFTLHDVPDYPAHLEVDYPEHLSRGLVWVKWWLLAIPHYLVVAALVGGTYAVVGVDDRVGYTGLIPVLVLVAAVLLLVTGRYPPALFDLVLGLNRWVLRVAAYAGLMSDVYPPFRLDQGDEDPMTATYTPTPRAVERSVPASPGASGGWTLGRALSVVAGSVAALTAVALAVAGVGALVLDRTGRNADGFLYSPTVAVSSSAAAVTSVHLLVESDGVGGLAPDDLTGDLRVSATGASGVPLFLGVGPADRVATYLDGVARDTVVGIRGGTMRHRMHPGARPAVPPADAGVWTASSTGPGTRTLTVTPHEGDWTVVLMNADGSPGIEATVAAGAELPTLSGLGTVLLSLAALAAVAAVLLVAIPVVAVKRTARRRPSREQGAPT